MISCIFQPIFVSLFQKLKINTVGLLDSLKNLFSKGQSSLENTVQVAKNAMEHSGETFDTIKNQVSEMSSSLQEQGKELMDKTVEAAKDVVENSGGTLEGLKNKVSELSADLQEEGKELLNKTEDAIHQVKDSVVEKGNDLIDQAKNKVSGQTTTNDTNQAPIEEDKKA